MSRAAMVECPNCDPCNPELDEDGRPYTCYRCCDTGRVTLASRIEEEAEKAAWLAANPPAPRYVAPAPAAPVWMMSLDDDIPF